MELIINMNGNNIFHYKSFQDNLRHKRLAKTRENLQKFYSFETRNKANCQVLNEKLEELRKAPELLKKILDTAIGIEKEQREKITYELCFSIQYFTVFGERIAITGDTDFLGNWDPLKGLELEWNEGGYWRAIVLMGEGNLKDFEYKYVCIKKGEIVWENGRNRMFGINEVVKRDSHLVFSREDYWQNN